jgi:hypothetical protein
VPWVSAVNTTGRLKASTENNAGVVTLRIKMDARYSHIEMTRTNETGKENCWNRVELADPIPAHAETSS